MFICVFALILQILFKKEFPAFFCPPCFTQQLCLVCPDLTWPLIYACQKKKGWNTDMHTLWEKWMRQRGFCEEEGFVKEEKTHSLLVSQSPTVPKGRENQREKQSWSLISQWNWFGMFCLNGLTQTWTYIIIIIITLFSTSVGKSTLKCLPSCNLLRSESSSTSRDALYWMSSCLFKYRSVRLCHFFFNNSDGFCMN